MAIENFGIPLAYIIVTALMLWAVIAAKGSWMVKGVLIACSLAFGIGLWHSLGDLQGWPVETEMPPRFEIKWLVVEEPDKKTGDTGAVYVLAVALGSDPPPLFRLVRQESRKTPRIYRLPYSRLLHEQSEKIDQELRAGKRFFAVLKKGEGGRESIAAGRGGPASTTKKKGTGANMRGDKWLKDGRPGGSLSYQDYVFHELPPAQFPTKNSP